MNTTFYKQGAAHALRTCLLKTAGNELAKARARADLTSLTLGLGGLGLAAGGHALESALTPTNARRINWISELRKKIELPQDISVRKDLKNWLLSHYNPQTRTIHIKSEIPPAVLAHEMGHASGGLRDAFHKAIRMTRVPALLMASMAPTLQTSGVKPDSTAWNIATYGPAALMTPTLAEEARASYRALRALHSVGGRSAMLRGILSLLPAFSTYAIGASAPIVSGAIIRGAYNKEKSAQPLASSH